MSVRLTIHWILSNQVPGSFYCSLSSLRYRNVVHQSVITKYILVCKPTHLITKISNPGKSFSVRTVSPNVLLNSISDCMIWQFQNYQINYFLITRADGTPEVDTPQKQKSKLFPGQLWQGVFCLVAMAHKTSQTITCCRMMQVAHHRKNPNNSPASNVDNSRTKPKRQLRCLSILSNPLSIL